MNQLNNRTHRNTAIRPSVLIAARPRVARALIAASALGLVLSACNVATESEPGQEDPPTGKVVLECGAAGLFLTLHDSCEAMDARATNDGYPCDCYLGVAWNGSECVSLGDCQCEGSDCDKLYETHEECEQAQAQCTAPSGREIACGSTELFTDSHDECEGMDAVAMPDDELGSCDCYLGVAWNGSECVGLADCKCVGADCDKLTETFEECEAAHQMCD